MDPDQYTAEGQPGMPAGSAVPVTEAIGALLAEVDEIRARTEDSFDLAALGRQAELLERAHDTLTRALAEVDPR